MKNYQELFASFELPSHSPELLGRVMEKIEQKEHMALKRKLIFHSVFSVLSMAGLVLSWQWLQNNLASTGFWHFFSLLFSDSQVILAYWQNFALALIETLPVTALLLLSAVTLICLTFLKRLIKDLKLFFIIKNHYYGIK